MTKAWQVLDRRDTPDGELELRQRGDADYLICLAGRVLMNSRESRSEKQLGIRACRGLAPDSRVLVGGLGMGLTLRAVLDSVSSDSQVTVAELNEVVADWCRGPLASLAGDVLADSRVTLRLGDVGACIREAGPGSWDAIVIDLFEGPHAGSDATHDPFYGRKAIERCWRALGPGGIFAVWAEARDEAFEKRLKHQGFEVETLRPGRGGLRHWIVLARRPGATSGKLSG